MVDRRRVIECVSCASVHHDENMETERHSMTMSGDSTRDVLPRLSAELRVDFEPLDVRQLSIAMRSLHDYITLPCPSSG